MNEINVARFEKIRSEIKLNIDKLYSGIEGLSDEVSTADTLTTQGKTILLNSISEELIPILAKLNSRVNSYCASRKMLDTGIPVEAIK